MQQDYLIDLKPLLFQLLFQVAWILLTNLINLKPKHYLLLFQIEQSEPTKQTHQ
jgi:hypothetical protein